MIKYRVLITSLATWFFFTIPAIAITADEAESYILKVSGALEFILNEEKEKEAVYREFENLFATYGDVPIITRFLIGPTARSMTKAQLATAEREIKVYLSRKYGRQFEDYINAQVEITGVKSVNGNFDVRTKFSSPRESFNVSWLVSDKSGEIKLIDIIIEGISMLRIEKEEISAKLEKSKYDVDKFLSSINK